jgi:hypothetical protein
MIPLRASSLKYSSHWPSHIVIHHTAEFVNDVPKFKFDNSRSQAHKYIDYNFNVLHNKETRYHFLVDKIDNDYQIVVSQPLLTECVFEDVDSKHYTDIHIATVGNYDLDIVPTRLYKVLSYRLLSPLMRLFYLQEKDILFHSTISSEKTSCPGKFFEMDKLLNQLRSVRKVKAIRRG